MPPVHSAFWIFIFLQRQYIPGQQSSVACWGLLIRPLFYKDMFWPCHGFLINHYKSAVFGVDVPYHMLLHDYCLLRFVLSGLKHVQISWDEFFTLLCAPRCCTMSYALTEEPQEIWWLMSFDDWAVSIFEVSGTDLEFYWVLWNTQVRVSHLLCWQLCLLFWFAQCDLMRSLFVLWTFQDTRFTCDDFNWGVECYLWLF
jgi:hypothetical protein